MSAFLSFPTQLNWDAQTLASAVPIRLRLHQLFAFDAKGESPLPSSANGESTLRPCWRHREYLRAAELASRFRIC
ncbi:MAG: hypothetical protein JWL98_300 [Xanthomonadaceae bacterium]|nr:hypothetical protein [Xanthomonadaceae bacterium]